MRKHDPSLIAFKVTRNLGYGSILLGAVSLISWVLIFLIRSPFVLLGLLSALVIFLAFAGLIVIFALNKLGELTEIHKIKSGFKIFGYGLLLAFIGAPTLSITGSFSIFLAIGIIVSAIFVPLIGWILVLLGLVEYGKLEGSDNIVKYSFLAIFLTIVYPILAILNFSLISIGYQDYIYPVAIIDLFLGLLSLIISVLIGLEFQKISIRVRNAIDTLDLEELKKEIETLPLENLVYISRSRNIPYILLSSIKSG